MRETKLAAAICCAGEATWSTSTGPPLRLPRHGPEILRRFAIPGRRLVAGGDSDQQRLAEGAPEKVDRDRQFHRLRAEKIPGTVAAVRALHHRAVVDLPCKTRPHRDGRI